MAHRTTRRGLAALVAVMALAASACSAGDESDAAPEAAPSESSESSPTERTTDATRSTDPSTSPTTPSGQQRRVDPISLEALSRADLTGGGLRLGAIRERTPSYTSYDVSYRSTLAGDATGPLRVTGVLNVPTGRGPFPAVVLAHGYIDPAYYVRGQGMTRERGYLATRGFVSLHVDYRNHAESDDDPRVDSAVRLGYVTDVIAAAKALRSSPDVAVNDRVSLVGRSMGGGVTLKALTVEPGLFHRGVAWASVSSLEAENFRQFMADDGSRAELRARMRSRHGLPADDPAFWRGLSPRPRFDQITEPVLVIHGRFDDTCPPRWATESQRALRAAGADSTLAWYEDGHAFGPGLQRRHGSHDPLPS